MGEVSIQELTKRQTKKHCPKTVAEEVYSAATEATEITLQKAKQLSTKMQRIIDGGMR